MSHVFGLYKLQVPGKKFMYAWREHPKFMQKDLQRQIVLVKSQKLELMDKVETCRNMHSNLCCSNTEIGIYLPEQLNYIIKHSLKHSTIIQR